MSKCPAAIVMGLKKKNFKKPRHKTLLPINVAQSPKENHK